MASLFPDDWVRSPVDPDKPVWMIFHTKVEEDEISLFFVAELQRAIDIPKMLEHTNTKGCIHLGTMATEQEAKAYKQFCMVQRAKLYTPRIAHAFEIDSKRNFIAHIDACDLVPYDSWVLIVASDYKLLKSIIPIRPAIHSELEGIDLAWSSLIVSDLDLFKSLGLTKMHCIQMNKSIVNNPSLFDSFNLIVNGWENLCAKAMVLVKNEKTYNPEQLERVKQDIMSTIQYAGFDPSYMDRLIVFYRNSPDIDGFPSYPEMQLDGNPVEYF